MGLRKDFLIHKKRTVDGFGLVREDMFNINNNITILKNSLSSLEAGLKNAVDHVVSKIENIDKMINKKIKAVKSQNLKLQKKLNSQRKRIVQLNRKIEGKKAARKIIIKKRTAKKRTPRKRIIKTITPKKTTIMRRPGHSPMFRISEC